MSSAQLAADARTTKEVLERRGWNQGSLTGPGGSVCLVGAVRTAIFGTAVPVFDDGPLTERDLALEKAVLEKIRQVASYATSIPGWNDHGRRTYTEVLALLDDVIARAERMVKVEAGIDALADMNAVQINVPQGDLLQTDMALAAGEAQ